MKPVIISVPEGIEIKMIRKNKDCTSKLTPNALYYCDIPSSVVSQWRLSFRERISAFLFGSVYVGIVPESKGDSIPMHWAIASRHFFDRHNKIEVLWDKLKRLMSRNV